MPKRERPLCYCGCTRPATPGRYFATNRCARSYIERLTAGDDLRWCPTCQAWTEDDPYHEAGQDTHCFLCGNAFPLAAIAKATGG